MKDKLVTIDNIITIATIFLYSSFFLFEKRTEGRYFLLIFCLIIFLFMSFKQKGKIYFSIQEWHKKIIVIAVYSLISAIWAIRPIDSVQKFITITQILILLSILYSYYQLEDNAYRLFNIIKWGGYFVCIYSIINYGIVLIFKYLLSGIRLNNDFINVNSIGMLSAISIIIELYEMKYYRKLKKSIIFVLPSFFMILATQSRKAFFVLLIGIYFILLTNRKSSKKLLKRVILIIFISLMFIMICFIISKIEIFKGMTERVMSLMNSIGGEEEIGSSTYIRKQLFEIGWNSFKKNPILGIGIGCPHVLANKIIDFDAYLHNNYIELLCGGGAIGFILYYYIHFYLIKEFIKYKNVDYYGKNISIFFIFISFIMDLGMVSIYSKETYFQFMVLFLCIKHLKIRYKNYKGK